MSTINGNDIDDLFKRASENYPLRTNSSDWGRVAADLEKEPSLILPPLYTETDRSRRRRSFWLFLLLPLGGLGYLTWQYGAGHVHATADHGQELSGKNQGAMMTKTSRNEVKDATSPDEVMTKTSQHEVKDETSQNEGTAKTSQKEGTTKTAPDGATTKTAREGVVSTMSPAEVTAKRSKQGRNAAGRATGSEGPADKIGAGRTTRPEGPGGPGRSGGPGGLVKEPVLTAGRQATDPAASRLTAQRAGTGGSYAVNIPVKGGNGQSSLPGKGSQAKIKLQKAKPSFYAGLLASPDLSTVKFQSIKGIGTTYGILLGYTFNRRWAIETGLYVDRKKYYTAGEYFKKRGGSSNFDLQRVDGICNMLELPINVRYNLGSGEKMKWFATAGLSTYFMSKEYYTYQGMYNGWPQNGDWTNKKHSQYWFSVFNLSVGYEQKLGRIGNLRLEPTLRLPLAGIGTGSLPIMSAGFNIGITRRIW